MRRLALVVVAVLALAACTSLTPDQQRALRDAHDRCWQTETTEAGRALCFANAKRAILGQELMRPKTTGTIADAVPPGAWRAMLVITLCGLIVIAPELWLAGRGLLGAWRRRQQ